MDAKFQSMKWGDNPGIFAFPPLLGGVSSLFGGDLQGGSSGAGSNTNSSGPVGLSIPTPFKQFQEWLGIPAAMAAPLFGGGDNNIGDPISLIVSLKYKGAGIRLLGLQYPDEGPEPDPIGCWLSQQTYIRAGIPNPAHEKYKGCSSKLRDYDVRVNLSHEQLDSLRIVNVEVGSYYICFYGYYLNAAASNRHIGIAQCIGGQTWSSLIQGNYDYSSSVGSPNEDIIAFNPTMYPETISLLNIEMGGLADMHNHGLVALGMARFHNDQLGDIMLTTAEHICAHVEYGGNFQFRKGVMCNGNNSRGQVGNPLAPEIEGGNVVNPVSVLVAPSDGTQPNSSDVLLDINQMSAGAGHTVALQDDGTIVTWGSNMTGQLGRGHLANLPGGPIIRAAYPIQMSKLDPEERFKSISSGLFHTCAITQDTEELVCWGSNEEGQLGDVYLDGVQVPTGSGASSKLSFPSYVYFQGARLSNISKVIAKGRMTCVLQRMQDDEKKMICFGDNKGCQIAALSATSRCEDYNCQPPTVVTQGSIRDIELGTDAIYVAGDGFHLSRGLNSVGQLAQGNVIDRNVCELRPVIEL